MTRHEDTRIDDIHLMLGRIESKVDGLMDAKADHGSRLTVLEAWRSRLVGAVVALGAWTSRDHLSGLFASLHNLF